MSLNTSIEDSSLTLVIMAAGLGSRFGGNKQLASLGPNGETMLELSTVSAYKAGFSRVVLVIRPELESELEQLFVDRIRPSVSPEFECCFCYQSIQDLPETLLRQGFDVSHRRKPWGTAHALWSARHQVKGLMAVINADDYYGDSAFELLANGLKASPQNWMLVAYPIELTLSEHGGVNRGVCQVKGNVLQGVSEWTDIRQEPQGLTGEFNGVRAKLDTSTPVSMTCWGFASNIFTVIESELTRFILKQGAEGQSECYLPAVVQQYIDVQKTQSQHPGAKPELQICVDTAQEPWFGVTYPQDVAWVKEKLYGVLKNKNNGAIQ